MQEEYVPVKIPETITIKGEQYKTYDLLSSSRKNVEFYQHTGQWTKRKPLPEKTSPTAILKTRRAPNAMSEVRLQKFQIWWDSLHLTDDELVSLHPGIKPSQIHTRRNYANLKMRTDEMFIAWLKQNNLI